MSSFLAVLADDGNLFEVSMGNCECDDEPLQPVQYADALLAECGSVRRGLRSPPAGRRCQDVLVQYLQASRNLCGSRRLVQNELLARKALLYFSWAPLFTVMISLSLCKERSCKKRGPRER